MAMYKPKDADEYIKGFPDNVRQLLEQLRAAIKQAAPHAQEVISYGMPAYRQHGVLVYFAGYERHIGLYPGPSAIAAFKEEIAVYKSAKGSVQLPLDKPLPLDVVGKIVSFRITEDEERAQKRKKKLAMPGLKA